MSIIIQLEEPAAQQRPAPSVRAFFELAFRPLYLAGAAWALIAIGIWVWAPQMLTGPLDGIAWHAHEMLWGFIATIAVAFLMTAGANWTGINPLEGPALGVACTLWLVARIGFLAGGGAMFLIGAAAELGFFLLAAVAMMGSVYRTKNARNYAVPWLLVALGAADGLYLLAAHGDPTLLMHHANMHGGDHALLMQRFNVGLLVMALIALLIARRVIPFFAMRAIAGLQIPMQTRIGQVQLVTCAVAAACLLADQTLPAAIALGLTGTLSLLQVLRWKPWAVRANPLLWILYAGYAGLGIGLLMAACAAAGVSLPHALPVHVIAMAGFSVLIIGMVTRTALGHLGRPLAADRGMVVSYALVLLAVALRLAALAPSAFSQSALHLSAAAWIAAFALYLWRFTPLMIRPRR
jgi:uncharacterized protein involved in response to NO